MVSAVVAYGGVEEEGEEQWEGQWGVYSKFYLVAAQTMWSLSTVPCTTGTNSLFPVIVRCVL